MKKEKSTTALFNFIAVRLTRKSEGLLIGLTIPASYPANIEAEHDSTS